MAEFETGTAPNTRFSRDEAMAIVRRAIENESRDGDRADYDWADVVDIGTQCGVREDQIRASLHQLRSETISDEGLDRARRAKVRTWYNHLFTYAVVNGALFIVDELTGSGGASLVPAFLWGLVLVFHTRFAWFPSDAALEKKLIDLEKEDQAWEEVRRKVRLGETPG